MTKLESIILQLRADYKVNGEKEIDGPTDTTPTTKVLGKRQKSTSPEPSPSQNENKRIKIDEKLSVTKSDQIKDSVKKSKEEDKKGEEKKAEEPTRRSARNAGKEANYNIDELLDAADE